MTEMQLMQINSKRFTGKAIVSGTSFSSCSWIDKTLKTILHMRLSVESI